MVEECVELSTRDESASRRSNWHAWLNLPGIPEFILMLLSLTVYLRSLWLGFVYDDHSTMSGLGYLHWSDIPRLFRQDLITDHASNFYRPLSLLWTDLVHRVAGTNPAMWHLSQILLHTLCVVLVFHLALALLEDRGFAMLAAAVFALHPAHVEPVSWISDSADLVLGTLLLLSSLSFLRWLKSGKTVWWTFAWLLGTASCFVKEIGVLMPLLLLVLAFAVRGRVSQRAIVLTGGMLFLSSSAFLILRSQVLHGFSHPLSKADNPSMALTLPAAVCFYLSHLVFPVKLGLFYPLAFVRDWRSAAFLIPLLALAAILVAAVWLYGRLEDRRLFWFCAVWALVPLIAPLYLKLFPKFELVHDRYLYLPTIALGVGLAAAVRGLCDGKVMRLPRNFAAIAVAVLLGAAAVKTISYQGVWQSDLTLFRRALELTPDNDRAMVNLAVVYLEQNNFTEGIPLLQRAVQLNPDNGLATFDLGMAAWNRNDAVTAESYFDKAVRLEDHARWWLMLANAKYSLGKLREAQTAGQRAVDLNPQQKGAHLLLAGVLLQEGNPAAATGELNTELRNYPGEPEAVQAMQIIQEQANPQH